jgi:putative CRISPR-associated protein (TIGR02619 family)
MRWVHLITVGASMAQNALKREIPFLVDAGITGLRGLERGLHDGVIDFDELLEELFTLLCEAPKSMSAELNTSLDLLRSGFELRVNQLVYLFHTDTWIGRVCGETLFRFFEEVSRKDFDGLVACQRPIEVEGLGSHERFREGLANLLEMIADHIGGHKRAGDVVFVHATGGFKPESAMALLAANLPGLGAPVFYIHEHFREVVRIPAIPLSPRLLGVFEGLMSRVLQLPRVHRAQLDEEFGRDLVEEAIRLGWLDERGEYVVATAMGRLLWRRLLRLGRRIS